MIGSWSLKAQRNGRVQRFSSSHASRLTLCGGIVGRHRHQGGELPGAGQVAIVGEGSVVGGDHLGAQRGDASALDDAARVEVRGLLGVAPPAVEGGPGVVVAGGQEGVGCDRAGEAVGHLGDEPQPDQAAQSWPTRVMSRRSSASTVARIQSACRW